MQSARMATVTFNPSSSKRRFSSRVPNKVSMLGLISMFFFIEGRKSASWAHCLKVVGRGTNRFGPTLGCVTVFQPEGRVAANFAEAKNYSHWPLAYRRFGKESILLPDNSMLTGITFCIPATNVPPALD